MLKGKVFDKNTDSTVARATIHNITKKVLSQSGPDGSYTLPASENDLVIISSIGYEAHTVKVLFYMLVAGFDIELSVERNMLDSVTVVSNNYSADSLSRRNEYRNILDKSLPGITGRNTPSSGFGISLSPITYFSAEAKQKRKLKRRLKINEEQSYVDSRFQRSYVAKITGLQNDSLQVFMVRYRPSYTFCRNANQEDIIMYINNKLKIFLKHEEQVQ